MAVTTDTLTLLSTMECISVKCSFTGSPSGTLTAAIDYKVTGTSIWKSATVIVAGVTFSPLIDTRSTVDGDANSYVNQARGSIVGLTENTSYDVKITFSDSGGTVSGTNPKTGTISTKSWTPPTGGSIYYVAKDTGVDTTGAGAGGSGAPWATIDYAIAHSANGDTIKIRNSAAAYPPINITVSGASGAFRKLENDTGHAPVIGGAGGYAVITVDANYWWFKGLTFEATSDTHNGLYVAIQRHDIYIENFACSDFGLGAPADDNTWAVFQLAYPTTTADQIYNIFCRNNTFTCSRNTSIPNHLFVDFVYLSYGHTMVFDHNTITGTGGVANWWDCIGTGGTAHLENVDYSNNTFTDYNDDSIELDGLSVNVRAWGNVFTSSSTLSYSAAGLSMQPVLIGPCYVFRNLIISSATNQAGGFKSASAAGMLVSLVCHNTIDLFNCSGGGHPIFDEGMAILSRNNIGYTHGNAYQTLGGMGADLSVVDHDYNVMYMPGSNYTDTQGTTIGAFRTNTAAAGYPQDANSINLDPLLTGPDDHITSSSPAHDAGIEIAMFNSRDGRWGYSGTRPDIGYYEVDGFYAPPSTPPGSRLTIWTSFDV